MRMPEVQCLMLTVEDDAESLFQAILAGATGLVGRESRDEQRQRRRGHHSGTDPHETSGCRETWRSG